MPYDEKLAGRIRKALTPRPDVMERKMFGGLAFMLRGNMCCGAMKDTLMLRLGHEGVAGALKEPHVRPREFTGRTMKSMACVDPEGIASDEDLYRWVNLAADFAESLPPK